MGSVAKIPIRKKKSPAMANTLLNITKLSINTGRLLTIFVLLTTDLPKDCFSKMSNGITNKPRCQKYIQCIKEKCNEG